MAVPDCVARYAVRDWIFPIDLVRFLFPFRSAKDLGSEFAARGDGREVVVAEDVHDGLTGESREGQQNFWWHPGKEVDSGLTVGDFEALDTEGRPLRQRPSEIFYNPAELRGQSRGTWLSC